LVLSEEEICKILQAPNNLKHNAILMTLYSSGLRMYELLNLKLSDILSGRGLVLIRGGKEKKDRTSILSEKILKILRKYYKKHKQEEYLFVGQFGGQYSARSV